MEYQVNGTQFVCFFAKRTKVAFLCLCELRIGARDNTGTRSVMASDCHGVSFSLFAVDFTGKFCAFWDVVIIRPLPSKLGIRAGRPLF